MYQEVLQKRKYQTKLQMCCFTPGSVVPNKFITTKLKRAQNVGASAKVIVCGQL